jgi:hypothetical protein
MKTQLKHWDFYACLVISLTAFAFILYRIFNIGFTMDEWGMWKDSIRPGLEALITFKQQIPQSHFFQGLFAMPFLNWLPFNPCESTRIPSLLMFPVYAWAGFHLANYFKNSLLRLLFFCVWLCPQIILEYFGMARGYAFMFAGCAAAFVGMFETYNNKNTDIQKERWTKFSILSAAVALLSVLTFSYGYFMVTILLLLRYWIDADGTFWSKLKETISKGSFVIWTGVVLGVFYLPRYLILRHSDSMQWGGTNNVISDSFTSFLDCFACIPQDCHNVMNFGHVNPIIVYLVFGLLFTNFLVFVIANLVRKTSGTELMHSPFLLASIGFFGIIALMQLLFWFFNMQLPTRRTVLYLWPITVMLLGFGIAEQQSFLVRTLNVIVMLFALEFSMTKYNVDSIVEASVDCQNKEIANQLYELSKYYSPERPMFVGVTDCMRYTIWYHLEYDCKMKENPGLANNPVVKMFGDRLILYSLSYGYPQPFPNTWHHFPFSPDFYVLSPYEPGQQPNLQLMEEKPLYTFDICKTAIYKATQPTNGVLGCNVTNCQVCQMLYSMVGGGKPND